MTQHGATRSPAEKGQKLHCTRNATARDQCFRSISGHVGAQRGQRIEERRKGMKGPAGAAKTSTNPAAPAGAAQVQPASSSRRPAKRAGCGAKAKKPNQQVQQIKAQHTIFMRSQSRAGSGGYLQPELSD